MPMPNMRKEDELEIKVLSGPPRITRSSKLTVAKTSKSKRRKSHKRVPKLSSLKKTLDSVFSSYIRRKYSKYCYTCGRKSSSIQCGHFVSRQYLATRWLEDNCRPQCPGCNIFGNGRLLDFEENLKKEIGDVRVEEIKKMRHYSFSPTRDFYEGRITRFMSKLKEL